MDIVWGMVVIGDTILVDDTEITMSEWLEFVLNGTNIINPDMLHKNDTIFDHYFLTNPKKNTTVIGTTNYIEVQTNAEKTNRRENNFYLNLPVANVSFEQAIKFCEWRKKTDSIYAYANGLPQRYIFQLPSIDIYNSIIHGVDSIYKDNGLSRFNYKGSRYFKKNKKSKNEQMYCGKKRIVNASFFSNDLLLYDLQGNVAEMTSTPELQKVEVFIIMQKNLTLI
jgi:formylglycine-generating enzyme required for sulfatase activity